MNNPERFERAAAAAGVALLLSPDAHAAAYVEPAQDNLNFQGLSLEVNNGWNWNQPEAAGAACTGQSLDWEVVIKQVPFFDLERLGVSSGTGRQGIFDKGKNAPMDPYIEKPALGGVAKALSKDGKTEYDSDRISQTAPKLNPKIKVPGMDQNVGFAQLKWSAPCNDEAVHPVTGQKIPSLAIKLVSSQDEKNTSYDTVIPAGGVAVHWFGREVGIKKVEDKMVVDYAQVLEMIDDRNQPLKDLPTETRVKIRESVSKKIQDQRTAEAQRLELQRAAQTQTPTNNQGNDIGEIIKAKASEVWEWVKSNPVPVAIMAVLLAGFAIANSGRHIHLPRRRHT